MRVVAEEEGEEKGEESDCCLRVHCSPFPTPTPSSHCASQSFTGRMIQQQRTVGSMAANGCGKHAPRFFHECGIARDLDWLLHHPASSHLKLSERLLIKSLLREYCLCRGIPEFVFVQGVLRGKDETFWGGKCALGPATGLSPGMAAKV